MGCIIIFVSNLVLPPFLLIYVLQDDGGRCLRGGGKAECGVFCCSKLSAFPPPGLSRSPLALEGNGALFMRYLRTGCQT